MLERDVRVADLPDQTALRALASAALCGADQRGLNVAANLHPPRALAG